MHNRLYPSLREETERQMTYCNKWMVRFSATTLAFHVTLYKTINSLKKNCVFVSALIFLSNNGANEHTKSIFISFFYSCTTFKYSKSSLLHIVIEHLYKMTLCFSYINNMLHFLRNKTNAHNVTIV